MAGNDVLMLVEGMPWIAEGVERRLPLHRIWRAADPERALAKLAPTIRAIAAPWHTAPVTAELMRRMPKLEIVASFGVGYDHVDAAWAGKHGIIVTHTPGVLDDEVADLAMGLTIAAVRQLPQAERHLRAGLWPKGPYPLSASLSGRTMGILGLGRIGKQIATRARAFGIEVVYHGRKAQPGAPFRAAG